MQKSLQINVFCKDVWTRELQTILSGVPGALVDKDRSRPPQGKLLFLDQSALEDLENRGGEWNLRGGRIYVLLTDEVNSVPEALSQGRVDDVLVHPFRPVEVFSRLFRVEEVELRSELEDFERQFGESVGRIQEDLELAERLQKRRLPERFPAMRGFDIKSRYLAGIKPGGDFFDVSEGRDGRYAVVLTHSTTYGLSSSVLGIVMKVAARVGNLQDLSSLQVVARIRDEVLSILREKDALSLVFGILSADRSELEYVSLGDCHLYHSARGAQFELQASQGQSLSRRSHELPHASSRITLGQGDRILIVSEGFRKVMGVLDAKESRKEPKRLLNELAFQIKGKLKNPDEDMPEQDCTAILIDTKDNVLKLADGTSG